MQQRSSSLSRALLPFQAIRRNSRKKHNFKYSYLVQQASHLGNPRQLRALKSSNRMHGISHSHGTRTRTRWISYFGISCLKKDCWAGNTIGLQSTEAIFCPPYLILPIPPISPIVRTIPPHQRLSAHPSHNKFDSIAQKFCPWRDPDPHMETPPLPLFNATQY